jgi:hypothetical protein
MLKQEIIKLKNGKESVKALNEQGETIESFADTDFGQDEGKIFRWTQMSAMKLERFSIRLGLAAQNLNLNPAELSKMQKTADEHSATFGFLPIAVSGQKHFVDFLDLLNDLLYQYEIFDETTGVYTRLNKDNIDDYISEIVTIAFLRNKALASATSFFLTEKNAPSTKAEVQAEQDIKQ